MIVVTTTGPSKYEQFKIQGNPNIKLNSYVGLLGYYLLFCIQLFQESSIFSIISSKKGAQRKKVGNHYSR